MIKTILLATLIGILGYFLGIFKTAKFIKKLNSEYRIPDKDFLPKSYDEFRNQTEISLEIGNLLDVAFRYGYEEKEYEEEIKIDLMLEELSGNTKNKY